MCVSVCVCVCVSMCESVFEGVAEVGEAQATDHLQRELSSVLLNVDGAPRGNGTGEMSVSDPSLAALLKQCWVLTKPMHR